MTRNPFIPITIFILIIGIILFFPKDAFIDTPPATIPSNGVHYVSDEITLLQGEHTITLSVDIAASQPAWHQGMMHRQEWGDIDAMLFAFPTDETRDFWMKDTQLPLDIIFFDSMGQVTNIIEDTVPNSEEFLPSLLPTQYVLELPAGSVDRLLLTDQVILDTASIDIGE